MYLIMNHQVLLDETWKAKDESSTTKKDGTPSPRQEELAMNRHFTTSKPFSYTSTLAIVGLLALPLSGSGWLMTGNGHGGPFEDETDWALASSEGIQEKEVDWTLAMTEAEEDETDWTLA
jgi:hypothetical protein